MCNEPRVSIQTFLFEQGINLVEIIFLYLLFMLICIWEVPDRLVRNSSDTSFARKLKGAV
jgi:hypothetical protein